MLIPGPAGWIPARLKSDLAADVDDKPLPAADGSAKLLVPSDAKPGRWVRGVGSILVVDPVAAARTAK